MTHRPPLLGGTNNSVEDTHDSMVMVALCEEVGA